MTNEEKVAVAKKLSRISRQKFLIIHVDKWSANISPDTSVWYRSFNTEKEAIKAFNDLAIYLKTQTEPKKKIQLYRANSETDEWVLLDEVK